MWTVMNDCSYARSVSASRPFGCSGVLAYGHQLRAAGALFRDAVREVRRVGGRISVTPPHV
jgi:hypothetical protein